MRIRAVVLAAALIRRRSAPRPPTSWCGGRRATTPRRTRRSGRSSPHSSRRAASRSSSSSVAQEELAGRLVAALEAGRRPTSSSARRHPTTMSNGPSRVGSWISRTLSARFRTCSIRTRSSCVTLLNGTTGQRRLYAAADGLATHHVHVWKSLLEQAGLHPRRHPEGVGSVLVLLVRPGPTGRARGHRPRRHLGRRAAHVGRVSRHRRSSSSSSCHAYDADYVTRDGRLVIDDPEVRRRLIKAIDSYTAIYRKGCTPPDSVDVGRLRQQRGSSWRRPSS